MCFAPQPRALFRHLNFQTWSRAWCVLYILTSKCASRHNGVRFFDISTSKSAPRPRCFVPFHLEMCFAPQRRGNFSSLIWPAGSAPAARRFSEPTFRPSGAPNHWKTQCFATFLPFPRICIFSLLTLSLLLFSLLIFLFSLPLPCSAFHLSILSEVSLLNFLRPYIYILYYRYIYIYILVGGIPTPLKNISKISQLGWCHSQVNGKS